MAERSTAAVDVASDGGNPPQSAKADQATADGGSERQSGNDGGPSTEDNESTPSTPAPELHSGHRLAKRYRLEECVTRLDGFSSWRAVDEKLRRAVGVHVLPADHPRSRPVLAAARSAALLGDPRFVQVLDAVEDNDLVYVVHEWLPDATPLSELLSAGPLPAHEAYQLVDQLAQALTAAHGEGLAHLRISPASVLRTGMGQYRIRGLAVSAALRGVTSDHPQRTDTEAIGAVLYAALTQRWPYEEDGYGLSGVGALAKGALVAPDQVRAGVHRGLSELAMRALVNDGATASRHEQACATPQELGRAVAELPRVPAPQPEFTPPPAYQATTYQRGAYGAGTAGRGTAGGASGAPPSPPALPGRTGKVLKWGVSALLIAALGLGSWQISDILMNRDTPADNTPGKTEPDSGQDQEQPPAPLKPFNIVGGKDFDPYGDDRSENPDKVPNAFDGDPSTSWYTNYYVGHADLGNLKPGVGIILDLGKTRSVRNVTVGFEGHTTAELLAAPESATGMPTSYGAFRSIARGSGSALSYKAEKPVKTQFVLVWLTKLPQQSDGQYRGRVTEVKVLG